MGHIAAALEALAAALGTNRYAQYLRRVLGEP